MVATTKFPVPTLEAAQPARFGWRQSALLVAAVFAAETVLLGTLAAGRGVNADEGFYLLAGWRVLAGQRPYTDFFFPQMPYLPYLHAAILALTGPSLLAGRALSVVTAALLAALLAAAATRLSGRLSVGIGVAFLYAGNALLLNYTTVSKTYGVVNLALVVALLLITGPGGRMLRPLLAGACAGLAVGVRLPSAAVLLVLLLWSLRGGLREAVAFAAGAILASLPWLWLAAQDPQGFWFGNVEFHALRRELIGLGPVLGQKVEVLSKWVLLPQSMLLWVLAFFGVILRPRQSGVAVGCAVALAFGYLAATPTYLEYMVQVVPFLLLAAIPAIAVLLGRRGLALAAVALYVVGLVAARRPAPEGTLRAEKARLWQLQRVQDVSDFLREHSEPGDRILSWWEGYPLLAGREGFRGVGFWESNVARKVPPEVRRRHHLLHGDDLLALVEAREARLIVVADGNWDELMNAVSLHYETAARFGSVQVFRLREDGPAAGRAASRLSTAARRGDENGEEASMHDHLRLVNTRMPARCGAVRS